MKWGKYLSMLLMGVVVLGCVDLHAWWFGISRELSSVQFLIGWNIYWAVDHE